MNHTSVQHTNIFSVLKTSPLNSPVGPHPINNNMNNNVPIFSLLEDNPNFIESTNNNTQSQSWADVCEQDHN